MNEYFTLKYKSSPEGKEYIFSKNGDKIIMLNTSLSPEKLGIKIEQDGSLSTPKYFSTPKKLDKNRALQLLSKDTTKAIEKLVNSL